MGARSNTALRERQCSFVGGVDRNRTYDIRLMRPNSMYASTMRPRLLSLRVSFESGVKLGALPLSYNAVTKLPGILV